MLTSLSQETGESMDALLDKALGDLQESVRARRANGTKGGEPKEAAPKPIWEKMPKLVAEFPMRS